MAHALVPVREMRGTLIQIVVERYRFFHMASCVMKIARCDRLAHKIAGISHKVRGTSGGWEERKKRRTCAMVSCGVRDFVFAPPAAVRAGGRKVGVDKLFHDSYLLAVSDAWFWQHV